MAEGKARASKKNVKRDEKVLVPEQLDVLLARVKKPTPELPPTYKTPLGLDDEYTAGGKRIGIFSSVFGYMVLVCYVLYGGISWLQIVSVNQANAETEKNYEEAYASWVNMDIKFTSEKDEYDRAWKNFLAAAREQQLSSCDVGDQSNIPRCEFFKRITSGDHSAQNTMYIETLIAVHGNAIYGAMPPRAPEYATLSAIVLGQQPYEPFESFTKVPIKPDVPMFIDPWDDPVYDLYWFFILCYGVPCFLVCLVGAASEFRERATFNHRSYTWYSWPLITVIAPWLLPCWVRSLVTETVRRIKFQFTLRAHATREKQKLLDYQAEIDEVKDAFFKNFDRDLAGLYVRLMNDETTFKEELNSLPSGEHVAVERVNLEVAIARLRSEIINIADLQHQRTTIADKAKFAGVQEMVTARLLDTRGQRMHFQSNIDAAEEIIELEEASKT